MKDLLFIGVYPCGLVYADRGREVAGDYARLAFLPYRTLAVEWAGDCPEAFKPAIRASVADMQARRGQPFEVSTSGQNVTLGV
jgi:hypothetical protein